MAPLVRRRPWALIFIAFVLFLFYSSIHLNASRGAFGPQHDPDSPNGLNRDSSHSTTAGAQGQQPKGWRNFKPRHPVTDMRPLPTGQPLELPKIQNQFGPESDSEREVRLKRRDAVKAAMKRCWSSYRKHAWMSDELRPVSGGKRDPFGGWSATLVDSLDTLWIMGLKHEFEEAVTAAATISFDKIPEGDVNLFETNIRYLGGFLAAYDLSGDRRLLAKAHEVGEMIYAAFDTPNHMPVARWNARDAADGKAQLASGHLVLAELGSFSLEFTRLSILTGDPKWFDAAQRITDALRGQQQDTRLPGMWPVVLDARKEDFRQHGEYTLGAMADSLYEYLPKTYALVGGLLPEYRDMYLTAMDTAIRHNLYRPMLPDEKDVLVSGHVHARTGEDGEATLELRTEGQHLVCFAGGMFAIGGRLFGNDTHVEKGEKLTDGCVWAYHAMPTGIMPEVFFMAACDSAEHCPWDEDKWRRAVLSQAGKNPDEMTATEADRYIARHRLPKGFTGVQDPRYILRPEAIESVFILYRVTGRKDLLESAWQMWEAVEENTKTPLANSALVDVTVTESKPEMDDTMESFWLGETLKYFYLVFSEPDLISLDEYVFNTEAHPLRRWLP
ncbi:hypothetical protein VTK26DRAFT_7622 [Humicola hyalothermophila]